MVLLIDNFDSFSHILADYFLQLGVRLKIVRNDTLLANIQQEKYSGLILSPGPETPEKAGNLMEILAYYHDKIPVLGVCLGHQAIGEFFGAKLIKGANPVHGKVHQVSKTSAHHLLQGLPETFEVTRYHSLILTALPESLVPLLETADGVIMAMVHQKFPILGIQYHPEAYLTEFGMEILSNWLDVFVKPGSTLADKLTD